MHQKVYKTQSFLTAYTRACLYTDVAHTLYYYSLLSALLKVPYQLRFIVLFARLWYAEEFLLLWLEFPFSAGVAAGNVVIGSSSAERCLGCGASCFRGASLWKVRREELILIYAFILLITKTPVFLIHSFVEATWLQKSTYWSYVNGF